MAATAVATPLDPNMNMNHNNNKKRTMDDDDDDDAKTKIAKVIKGGDGGALINISKPTFNRLHKATEDIKKVFLDVFHTALERESKLTQLKEELVKLGDAIAAQADDVSYDDPECATLRKKMVDIGADIKALHNESAILTEFAKAVEIMNDVSVGFYKMVKTRDAVVDMDDSLVAPKVMDDVDVATKVDDAEVAPKVIDDVDVAPKVIDTHEITPKIFDADVATKVDDTHEITPKIMDADVAVATRVEDVAADEKIIEEVAKELVEEVVKAVEEDVPMVAKVDEGATA